MKGSKLSYFASFFNNVYQQMDKQGLFEAHYVMILLLSLTLVFAIFFGIIVFLANRAKTNAKKVEQEILKLSDSVNRARSNIFHYEQKMHSSFNKTPRQAVRSLWEAKTVIAALDRRVQEINELLAHMSQCAIKQASALLAMPLDLQASPVECINQFTEAPHLEIVVHSYQCEEIISDLMIKIEKTWNQVGIG